MFKKSMTILLALSLLASGAAVYAADDTAADLTAPAVMQDVIQSDRLQALGEITEVGDEYIVVSISTDGVTKTSLQLNVSEETVLIDSEQATAVSLSDLEVGESIFAVYSSIMTRSIPAQSSAALIATNIDKGGALNLVRADSVEADSEGNLVVTDNTQDLMITIAKDALVRPYQTKNIVKLSDITPGSELVLWYEAVTLSLPAQAATDKAVLIAADAAADDEATGDATEEALSPIDEATALGFLEGVEIKADKAITREQFAGIAYNMLNKVKTLPAADESKTFNDTDCEKVLCLATAGIINGKADAIFAPQDALSLEETAVITMRMAEYADASLPTVKIAGDSSVAVWARPSVETLRVTGILAEAADTNMNDMAIGTILNLYHYLNQ